jgi:hypothetical protein
MADVTIILFDLSVLLIIAILSYLSKRLGDAMKTAPYYMVLYVAGAIVLIACGIDIASAVAAVSVPSLVALVLRCIGGILALAVALRYWRWLFSEFFGV